MESVIHLSLHLNWHHQIAFDKFNRKIHHQAPYEREGGISNKWLLLISEMHLKVFNGKMHLGI